MSVTRQTLLERVRDASNHDAWRDFFGVYEPLLVGYVRKHTGDRGMNFSEIDVQETVQEIFIKLYKALPSFELDYGRGRFRSWLWRITVNAILDRNPARKAYRRAQAAGEDPERARPRVHDEGEVDLRHVSAPAADADAEWDRAYRGAILRKVLEAARDQIEPTNPNKWASFERHALQGRPAADVARELGINANLVYQNSARVLQTVRKMCLEEYDEAIAT